MYVHMFVLKFTLKYEPIASCNHSFNKNALNIDKIVN